MRRGYRPWTDAEDAALRAGGTIAELAERFGRTRKSVECRMAVLDCAQGHRQHWTEAEDAVLRAGGSTAEVAARLGRSETSVNKRRARLGLTGGTRRPWNDADTARLARLVDGGERDVRILCAATGFSRAVVYNRLASLGVSPAVSVEDRLRTLWGTAPLSRVAKKLGMSSADVMAQARQLGLPGATARRALPMIRKAAPPKPKIKAAAPAALYSATTVAWARANRGTNPEARMIAAMLDAGHARAA